jgi:hypothetical protein
MPASNAVSEKFPGYQGFSTRRRNAVRKLCQVTGKKYVSRRKRRDSAGSIAKQNRFGTRWVPGSLARYSKLKVHKNENFLASILNFVLFHC